MLFFFVFTVLTVRLDKSQLNKPISRLNKSLTGFKIRLLRADPETDIFEISPELTLRFGKKNFKKSCSVQKIFQKK